MRVLIACEESQAVTIALRNKGIEAFSCDIIPCSGGHPEWHIEADVLEVINDKWDAMIAFPPCTHLCSSGARWFAEKRRDGRQKEGVDFFMKLSMADIPKIAIENPVGIMSSLFRRPDQIIQPWQFGHGETKATCLWLKNLPLLYPTKIVDGRESKIHKMPPGKERGKLRSKTYIGIAEAMANQWFGENL